ncbi:MAG TPA: hypothetical protein VGQ76_21490 [Thermoanaerobaculia bacterium]|nr:hypothetical protein [Thermoanaerobaculia bacterium]
MARRLRKHRTALIALAVYNFVLFFPIAFMGRVVSPNDVFYNYSPWSTFRPAEVQTQNSMLNDPPTAYFTLMTLARSDWRTFHWNPYIASGIPGFGSSASAILSPFILLPTLLVPLAWIYTAILFLKLNASFVFAYLWLREERLGRTGAAVGAIVIAGAGVYAVRWLWQITNATVLYPALLWIVRRAMNGKRTSIALVTPIALAYALAGFPAAMAYGAWVVAIYAVYLRLSSRASSTGPALDARDDSSLRVILGVVLALMIATPSLVPFVQFLKRSGYLEMREGTSLTTVFPSDHWRSFIEPDRLGHPARKDWSGDRRLGPLNNYTETTIYLGLLTIPLALLGIFRRRARARWFWLACAVFVIACMFGAPFIAPLAAKLPGLKFSALARVGLLLPLPIGYLAAAGTRLLRRPTVAALLVVLIAYDLALLAGRFYPYMEPRHANLPDTPMTKFLRNDRAPFRIAPMFDYLWPNSSELVRVEDVRSHFGSERDYRRMLLRIDPTSWSGTSTVLTFNSLNYNFNDPLNALLGIRWYIEHHHIDILKWGIFGATVPGVPQTGNMQFRAGAFFERVVTVDAEPFWAIELPVDVTEARGPNPRMEVTLLKNGAVVWSRAFPIEQTKTVGKVYIPLRPYARLGERVTLRVHSIGMSGWMPQAGTQFFYGRVTTPVIFDRQLPDGKLFRNLAELPRFRAVAKLRKLNDDEFLAARDVDFENEAVITDDPIMPPSISPSDAHVTLTHYAPNEQRVTTQSSAPFYLASSEKLTPELRVTIDGRAVRAIETDMLFAGVTIPAGKHEVVFSRRIARGWWWIAALGLALWLGFVIGGVLTSSRQPK